MRCLAAAMAAIPRAFWRRADAIHVVAPHACTGVAETTFPLADAPTAARRMAIRFPGLAPKSRARADFDAWLDDFDGSYDFDERDELYRDVCRTFGWLEDDVCDNAFRDADAPEVDKARAPETERKIAPALDPVESAETFASWVISNNRSGHYVSEALTELYLEHCAEIGVEPTPQNQLRTRLDKIPGISRGKQVTVDMRSKGGNRKDRRLRSQEWKVFPESAETELPFDLPMAPAARMAA